MTERSALAFTAKTILELRGPGLDPAYWKVKGFESRDRWHGRGGRDGVGCIVLGRDENEQKVVNGLLPPHQSKASLSLQLAGRPLESLVVWLDGKATRQMAVYSVAQWFERFIIPLESVRARLRKIDVVLTGIPCSQ